VNPADRVALLERLARAAAWTGMTEDERNGHRRRAAALIEEIEISREQIDRIGWMLVELDPADAGEGSES
jgi:hypothetical protein